MFKNWFFWVIVLLVIGGGFFIYKEATKPRSPVTAPGETIADLGREHVQDISQVEYNSNPPTSGAHFPVWLKAGVYKAPVSDGYQIHSLEHGYIIVSYNCEKSISDNEFSIFNLQFSKNVYAADNMATTSASVSDIMTKMQNSPGDAAFLSTVFTAYPLSSNAFTYPLRWSCLTLDQSRCIS